MEFWNNRQEGENIGSNLRSFRYSNLPQKWPSANDNDLAAEWFINAAMTGPLFSPCVNLQPLDTLKLVHYTGLLS